MTGGDQTILGIVITGALTSLTTWAVARRQAKAPETTAEAALRATIAESFRHLAERYEARDKAFCDEIAGLRDEIKDLTAHIDRLEGVLRENGLAIPPREPREARPPLTPLHLVAG